MAVADGTVSVIPCIVGEEKSQGGLILAKTEASKYQKLAYGIVTGSGKYMDHQGVVRPEVDTFPLPVGTLVEHKNFNCWESQRGTGEVMVKPEDITAYWHKSEPWPAPFRKEKR